LAARQHRIRQALLALHQEDDHCAGGRLLQRLEEGIGSLGVQGVGIVNYCNTAPAGVGAQREHALEATDLADAQITAVCMFPMVWLVADAARRQ
jgi:hypothetical protein